MKRAIIWAFLAFSVFSMCCVDVVGNQSAWAASKSDETEDEEYPEFEYLQMPPLILPVITEKGATQQVSIIVSIEMLYGTKDDVSIYEPRLADAYLRDLYGALGTGRILVQGKFIDAEAVKQRLTAVTEKVLGREKFHDVLLQVVQQRPL
ncbi:MAG: hypothetical protein OXT65_01380 [Alphaproteobacteria bacterium]|nr:hypothetical protein [Alphaproteobacteria bacterium]